ncbi:Hsp20/alpha crystallin family protein [Mucilaginibacter gotjawali]|uniref:HSP20 family protein n=2 Tax=Mucilaginibacter gotjawali TaxID=1550579 RepID=A0A839SME0_9SPHI|nr:Hsp20/alpha crystallin family protein [Mucilaginibacter gotjawali]MBB3057669.1 HSP20 family protein [Mucilaginibacter gotjawali]BAU55332.1 Hsp20/alpha crystallin family protein [Mucilaginibacter gotjawali]
MFGNYNSARGAQGCGHAFGKHGRFRGEHFRRPKYNLPINIADNETNFEVYVYAPGYAKENIRLSVQDDILYISGTRTVDEENLPNFSKQEYPIKSFERMLNLNGQVDIAAISAKQEDGVLIITLPKNAGAQKPSQEIPVN